MLIFTLFDPLKSTISSVISLAGGQPQLVVKARLVQLTIMILGIFTLGPLLGINGVGIVCHGGSSARAIKNAIQLAARYVNNQVLEKMSLQLKNFDMGG